MIEACETRESVSDDVAAIENLYRDAFPDEDLLPLVSALLREEPPVLSLVAVLDGVLVGHVIFTACSIVGGTDAVALLGPLAVAPARHGQGIGSAIVREGLGRLKQAGTRQVCVLGDPAYYRRFGFEPEVGVTTPYPLPEEWRRAWQSLHLADSESPIHGMLCVPRPWRQRALWAP